MRILHLVEFYSPSVGGAQECVRQISERLVESGEQVTVYTSRLPGSPKNEIINGVNIERFDVHGNAVRGISGKDIERFKSAVVSGEYDIIMCYAAQQWTFDLLNEVVDDVRAKLVLVPCGFSGLNDPAYRQYFEQMTGWLKKYDSLVLLSETYQDAKFIQAHGLTHTTLIPNCADEREFSETLTASQNRVLKNKYGLKDTVIITIGGFTGMKGQLETMSVFKRLPIQNASLVVIGNNDFNNDYFAACKSFANNVNSNNKNAKKNVVILETGKDIDRKHTIQLLQLSNLFLFMSYIEASPLVLFEAMAASTPFVSTSVGNAAEIAQWSKAGAVVGGKKDQYGMLRGNKLLALIKSTLILHIPWYQNRLARNGRRSFETRFNWATCSKMYAELYEGLLKK